MSDSRLGNRGADYTKMLKRGTNCEPAVEVRELCASNQGTVSADTKRGDCSQSITLRQLPDPTYISHYGH